MVRFQVRGMVRGNRCYVFDAKTNSIIAASLSLNEAMEIVQEKNRAERNGQGN